MLRPLGTSREAPFDEEEVLRRFFEVLRQFQVPIHTRMLDHAATAITPTDPREALAHLTRLPLDVAQGTNNYHNLTKISSREIYRRLKAKAPPRVAAEVDDEQDQAEAEAEAEAGYVPPRSRGQRAEGREKGADDGCMGCIV